MKSERWPEIKKLCLEALELDGLGRERFLKEIGARDEGGGTTVVWALHQWFLSRRSERQPGETPRLRHRSTGLVPQRPGNMGANPARGYRFRAEELSTEGWTDEVRTEDDSGDLCQRGLTIREHASAAKPVSARVDTPGCACQP